MITLDKKIKLVTDQNKGVRGIAGYFKTTHGFDYYFIRAPKHISVP